MTIQSFIRCNVTEVLLMEIPLLLLGWLVAYALAQ